MRTSMQPKAAARWRGTAAAAAVRAVQQGLKRQTAMMSETMMHLTLMRVGMELSTVAMATMMRCLVKTAPVHGSSSSPCSGSPRSSR